MGRTGQLARVVGRKPWAKAHRNQAAGDAPLAPPRPHLAFMQQCVCRPQHLHNGDAMCKMLQSGRSQPECSGRHGITAGCIRSAYCQHGCILMGNISCDDDKHKQVGSIERNVTSGSIGHASEISLV
jgi:hypothetical protein